MSDGTGPLFSIITVTRDRAALLPRVYGSLRAQTLGDFEWIVVDDGSTDGTTDLIAQWVEEAPFAIRYFRQASGGKHVGLNVALAEARGRYTADVDSDDWYLPHALQTFARVWESIPASDLDRFAGVVALCSDPAGDVIGTRFPVDVLDTTHTELVERHRVLGDKAGSGRREVMTQFPYPVIDGENLTVEGIVYRRIARRYRLRCVNEVVMVREYQPRGLSAIGPERFIRNPKTATLIFAETLQDHERTRDVARSYANVLRYSMHARTIRQSFARTPSKWWAAAMLPVAAGLFARDRIRMHRRVERASIDHA